VRRRDGGKEFEREEGPEQKLPGARPRHVKGRVGMVQHQYGAADQGEKEKGDDSGLEGAWGKFTNQDEQNREEEIELLFDGQRPGVEQRIGGGGVEVA
jgi:hypothetical protein